MIGQRVSHYHVISEIGRGGMGVVYLAEDIGLNRKVALKFLKPDAVQNAEAEARLVREARAASALDHPNIATIYEIGEWDGHHFIAMAYYDGETLADRLARDRPSVADTMLILRQIASALARAHAHGIVHRDLKPANIIIASDGTPKILDFGLATPGFTDSATESRLTLTGTTMGTVSFMSPEQAAGARVDHRTDVWAAGVIAFQMLTGELPFKGGHPAATLHSIIYDAAPDVKTVRADVPEALRRIVAKALAKDAANRFQSADDLAAALDGTARTPTAPATLRSRRRLPLVLAGAAMVVAIVTAAIVWTKRTAEVRRARAMLPDIQRLVDDAEWNKAYVLAGAARAVIPNDAQLASLLAAATAPLHLDTAPAGADVYRQDYSAPDGPWELLGKTPLDARIPLTPSYSRLKIVKSGFEPVLDVTRPGSRKYQLDAVGSLGDGMVRVAGGKVGVFLVGLDHLDPIDLGDYAIDRFETTNRQFKRFVDAGGYQKREYWRIPFVDDGKSLSWEEGIALLKDRSGRPGPATWEVGDYPSGQDDYPVGGVSWYEASAFAEFAGKQLPTIYHWANAANVTFSAAVVPLSNLGNRSPGPGPGPVGKFAGLTGFGALDMAGNVREWVANEAGSKRYLLGGAWDDGPDMFTGDFALPPFDRAPQNGFRLVKYLGDANLAVAGRPIAQPYRDFRKMRPVPDAIFDVYRRMYAYDQRPLNAVVEATDSAGRDWVEQRITYDAGYGQERVLAYLLLPKTARPPYQTVVNFPGDSGLALRSSKPLPTYSFDFIVKSGRAVLYPVFKSMYERGDGLTSTYPTETNSYKEHVIQWAHDLMRSVDYVQTREDLDARALAYYGISWGGRLGGIMLAIEPRFKTAVLNVSGLRFQKGFPEVEPINFLSRIKIPVLMLNGRYDFYFPVESSQKPMFEALGTPAEHKRHVIADGSHFVPRPVLIKESLDWLDKYLGPVR